MKISLSIFLFFLAATIGNCQTINVVTDYGAVGDAVQFYVNTVSNSVVVTTTNILSSGDIGKTIEVFGVGQQTYGQNTYGTNAYGNQDFVGTITNVVNATNIYVQPSLVINSTNKVPQATLTNAFATYGTDNTPAFSNAVFAANSYTNAIINIPDGTYLLMPGHSFLQWPAIGYAYTALVLTHGGVQFAGASEAGTVLLSKGAWEVSSSHSGGYREAIIETSAPVTNSIYPIVFKNLTFDGGVQKGFTGHNGFPINQIDGDGWDESHGAYWTVGDVSGTEDYTVFTNVTVQHFRGEEFKSIDSNTNGHISIHNCTFLDGNATALNIYGMWDVTGNYFSNVLEIAEYYQAPTANQPGTSYFRNNFATNINLHLFSINGGVWTAPPFIIESNTLYGSYGNDGILFIPAANVQVLNNVFHCSDYMTVFAVGAQGAQGVPPLNLCTSNILISGNQIDAPSSITDVIDYGSAGVNASYNVTFCSNYVTAPTWIFYDAKVGTQVTNASFFANTIIGPGQVMSGGVSGTTNCPFLLIQTNNVYSPPYLYYSSVSTNVISYSSGPFQKMDYVATSNLFVLQDTNYWQIPAGSSLIIDNRTNRWPIYNGGSSGNVFIQPSQSSSTSMLVSNGTQVTFFWNGTAWTTNALWQSLVPSVPTIIILKNGRTLKEWCER